MSILGYIETKEYLQSVSGEVLGRIVTDGKDRFYSKEYIYEDLSVTEIVVQPKNGSGNAVSLKKRIPLDEELIAFLGLYSGDGAKGVEDRNNAAKVLPRISFSQREPHLVQFAVGQFRKIFTNNISFEFQVGEDSAYFFSGEGMQELKQYYGGNLPPTPPLEVVKPKLLSADNKYLEEIRPNNLDNRECLAFHYFHMKAMKKIMIEKKREELDKVGVTLSPCDRIVASLRRPFKKGAREAGGSSRSDELALIGVNGLGELFLKIMHELESSIYDNVCTSPSGLICWITTPTDIGKTIDIKRFFASSPYGHINGVRPTVMREGVLLKGRWPRGQFYDLKPSLQIDPLWCYVAGLYLAEDSTPKSELFKMYSGKAKKFSLSFTSTENESIELVLRSLKRLLKSDVCLKSWKIKVGSQYFPELVVEGLKHGVPMLRGGKSGDGKLRTMEISLGIKDWALRVAPCLDEYENKFSHVEPTGAGIPRIDFSASSTICRWYFPLLMYSVFSALYPKADWSC